MNHPLGIARAAVQEWGAVQKVQELAGFLSLVMDLDPKIVVEIGSDAGGTLWAWQQICPRVIGVDLPRHGFSSGMRLNDHGCEIIAGDSHNPETRAQLDSLLGGEPADMLFIDGDHSFDGVKADYDLFRTAVRPGGVIGFHDICDHYQSPFIQVREFWLSLPKQRRESFISYPDSWGGIGALRIPRDGELVAHTPPRHSRFAQEART